MAVSDDRGFLDLLYSAALDPELWVPVMERFADMIGGTAANLSRKDVGDGKGSRIVTRMDPTMNSRYFGYYAAINPLHVVKDRGAYIRSWRPIILTDEDWMAKSDLLRSEYYNDMMRPQGVHSVLMIRLALHGSDVCALNVGRPRSGEQFGGRDLEIAAHFHPHLIRAFGLGQKLAADRARSESAAAVFDRSANPLFLLDRRGLVLRGNRAGEALAKAGSGLSLSGGHLVADVPSATRKLAALVAIAAAADPEQRAGGSMGLPSPKRTLPLAVTVAPLRSDGPTMFHGEACVLVCVTDLEAGVTLAEQRLHELFALTPAEARVALALLSGARPKEAAAALGISANTANIHLGRIFEKTGVKSQTGLMGLLTRTAGAALTEA